MLVLRLQRTGRENTPTYRIVLSEKARHAKKGTQEIVGHYVPAGEKTIFDVKKDRVSHWISKGAHPSDTLARLLKRGGMEGMDKFIFRYSKKKSRNAEPEQAAPVAAPAPAAEAPAA